MGPVNWLAVVFAANVAAVISTAWHNALFRTGRHQRLQQGGVLRSYLSVMIVMLIAAAMLGHSFARIGAQTLHAKPWLYFMQSGGLAIAFVMPALWLSYARQGQPIRDRILDLVCWFLAYLAMGGIFWLMG